MTQSQESQANSSELGNTRPTQKAKKDTRSRKWIFTWNNYTEQNCIDMKEWCSSQCKNSGFGREIAPTTGTPHLQGFWVFKNQKYFSQIKKKWPRVSYRMMKGTESQNLKYYSKDGNYTQHESWKDKLHAQLLKRYDDVVWKEWQQLVLDHINTVANNRDILWIWERKGNVGKSFLAKYIVLKYDCIIADGKKANIFNQVKASLDNEKEPKIVLLDIPRHNLEYINYGVLEQLKDGLIYSGKYEGGICAFNYPHLIVFANEPPNMNALSKDRIHAVEL